MVIIRSSSVVGVEANAVQVAVDIVTGVFGFETVGLSDTAVRESAVRVKAAIRSSGFRVPNGRIVVDLSPEDLRRDGTAFDLPIALGILLASGQADGADLESTLVVGELGLSGHLRAVRGVVSMVVDGHARGVTRVLCPEGNGAEAAAAAATLPGGGPQVVPVATLAEAVEVVCGRRPARDVAPEPPGWHPDGAGIDLLQCRFVPAVRRALEVAAAGGHHLLLTGPPGAGKTLAARALHGLLPDMSPADALEASRVYSVAGQLRDGRLLTRPPFRAPHHTASCAAMIGGGQGNPRPGEVSLAHGGVLFLDELPELDRTVREVLRQPLESGEVVIARAHRSVRFPARFQLVAAMNPCPCGWHGYASPRPCVCTSAAIERYWARVAPFERFFDLRVTCPPVPMSAPYCPGSSATVRARVLEARARSAGRPGSSGVARTIADLEGSSTVEDRHVAEARVLSGVAP